MNGAERDEVEGRVAQGPVEPAVEDGTTSRPVRGEDAPDDDTHGHRFGGILAPADDAEDTEGHSFRGI